MITIKNLSEETLILKQHVDTSVEGCRVVDEPMTAMLFKPGEEITMMGYEPGVSYTIRPEKLPNIPRVSTGNGPLRFKGVFPK